MLTTHLHLVSRLRISRAVSPFSVCLYDTDRKNCTFQSPVLILSNPGLPFTVPEKFSKTLQPSTNSSKLSSVSSWHCDSVQFLSNNDPVCMALYMSLQIAYYLELSIFNLFQNIPILVCNHVSHRHLQEHQLIQCVLNMWL